MKVVNEEICQPTLSRTYSDNSTTGFDVASMLEVVNSRK